MALSKSRLATALKDTIEATFGAPADSDKLLDYCQALADAFIDEVVNNAVVTGTVTSGDGAGGSVEGTVS